jgi:hypothetical protein
MGQLDQFADSVGDIIASLEKDAEALNRRKLALQDNSIEVLGRWRNHFDKQEASLKAAEAAINKLSNVPLAGTSTAPKADSRLVAALSETPVKSNGG